MQIILIAAQARNRVIGYKNALPWRLPADMRHFRQHTLGKPILMGRKTFASLGKPLPERHNLVLSRDPHFQAPGCEVVHSLSEALKQRSEPALMVIGGAMIYRLCLPFAHGIQLTLLEEDFTGDSYFPALPTQEWQEVSRSSHQPDEKNPYHYHFTYLQRIRPPSS